MRYAACYATLHVLRCMICSRTIDNTKFIVFQFASSSQPLCCLQAHGVFQQNPEGFVRSNARTENALASLLCLPFSSSLFFLFSFLFSLYSSFSLFSFLFSLFSFPTLIPTPFFPVKFPPSLSLLSSCLIHYASVLSSFLSNTFSLYISLYLILLASSFSFFCPHTRDYKNER